MADSFPADSVAYCVCTGQWTTSYFAVFGERQGVWRVIWDTTLETALPGPVGDTIRLGIEENGWPTLAASGISSAKGAQEQVLIHWNGSIGRVISPSEPELVISGDFLESSDLNSDGTLELVAWVREDSRGTKYTENVFEYDKSKGVYKYCPTLKSGKLSPRERNR